MAPASPSPSLLPDSSRLKWKKRRRESNLSNSSFKKHKTHEDDDEEEDEDEDANAEEDEHEAPSVNPQADPVLVIRETEVLSDCGHRVSNFPSVVRRSVNRPHPSVLAVVAAEMYPADGRLRPNIENISHGQLQALSAVLPDHPALNCFTDEERPSAYVCPPPLLEGNGVIKQFATDRVLVVPMHSDWFHPSTVHRLERQVVPHIFSGKSKNYAPERYLTLRNMVIAKHLENPGRRLSFEDCQSFVSVNDLPHDLSRIVRFLDNWGIINYLAGSEYPVPSASSPLICEEANGELQLATEPLKFIDSLVQFDRPRSRYIPENISSLRMSARAGSDLESPDLDSKIRKRLPEYCCSYCSSPLLRAHYQSQKEADTLLCSECYHGAKFIIGHSSLDFMRMDLKKGSYDIDGGDSWTDQETFLLLEALEKYHDNWNEIADYVGTKSKSQCFLHFIRLPMEDGLLENLHFPSVSCNTSKGSDSGKPGVNSDGCHTEFYEDDNSENELPFSSAANPVMALVAFLASAVGPRVAATCANAALTFLTNDSGKEDLVNSDSTCTEIDTAAGHASSTHKGNTSECQGLNGKVDSPCGPLPADRVKLAAMSGLSAAAVKAKLFADQEEREIQRLTATIINHQLKRLELKLKQFAEVETLLLKECEQVERSRQSILAERTRMLSSRFGLAGMGSAAGGAQMATGPLPMPVSMCAEAPAPSTISTVSRQSGMSMGGQPILPSVGAHAKFPQAFATNLPSHPHMPFMARQPMFPFIGPRLPLSAIHPPSSQAAIAMLSSGTSSSSVSSKRALLRSPSGNNSMG